MKKVSIIIERRHRKKKKKTKKKKKKRERGEKTIHNTHNVIYIKHI